jgi:dipeptidyl aminopeptidase/acylaminoacyl peptidase
LAGPNLIGWTSDGHHVIFFEPKGTKYHLVLLPKNGEPAKELMMKDWLFKEPSLAHHGKAIGFIGQTADRPPEAFVTNLDDFEPKQISHVNETFLSFPKIRTEVIRWQAHDGIEIEGLLTFPIGYQPGKRYPLLLVIHGGPMGAFDESYIGTSYPYPLASFAEASFMILRPNPRGSSGYGRKIRCLNYGDWGGQDFQDLMAGVDKAIEEGWADSDKLGIMGWSYGGYMTAWGITQTNRFKAASMGAGLCNLVSMVGTTDLTQLLPDYLGDLWTNPSLYHARSPLYHVPKVETPCLIQHGMDDKRVSVLQAYEYYEALKCQGKEATLVLYPRMGHRFSEPKMQLDLMERNLDWFSHYLLKE